MYRKKSSKKAIIFGLALVLFPLILSCAGDNPTGGRTLNIFLHGMHPQHIPLVLKVDDEALLKDVWEPRKMYKKFLPPVVLKGKDAVIYFSIGDRDTAFTYTIEDKENYLWLGYSMTNQFLISKEDSVTFRNSGGNDVVTYD